MSDPPSDEAVLEVVARCHGCSGMTAYYILESCGNDIEKAIEKYHSLEDLPPDPRPDLRVDDNDIPSEFSDDFYHQKEAQVDDEPPKDQHDEANEDYPWMPKLPILPCPDDFTRNGPRDPTIFELHELVGAIQAGRFDADAVRNYLAYFDSGTLDANLNDNIQGYPAMFYIISTHNIGIVREWIKYGGNPNVTWGPGAFPLVAMSILSGGKSLLQASRMLATLLRFGADPRVIPKAFYDPYCRDLPKGGPVEEELIDLDDDNKQWCTADVRAHLASALSLTQRYDLFRSSKVTPHSGREKEVLARQSAGEVLGLHQMIVAQSIATRWLKTRLMAYLALQRRKPLVLVFAGPSGHGKTELARRFGDLMSLELQVVDCTIFKHDNELFGPRPPYSGHEDGSPLNNFLTRKAGQRCIVFMDEFEKTSKDIHNTLLLPFQDGRYEDRRSGKVIDCSKTIWILATNKLDESIHEFCNANEKALFQTDDEEAQDKAVGKLCRQLRKEFIEQFSAPLGGRISEILPFLIFSPQESPLIVHKELMNFQDEVTRIVHLSLNREEDVYVGNIVIGIKNDATVCTTIAREEYDKKIGARSIAQAVERIVQDPLTALYLKNGDEFDEYQRTTYFEIDVNVDEEVEVRLVLR
ncbi:P-loop containing nucleoside triphosphate hydrolase protein [Hypoxylon sp. FL1150]|nr:P-loop containing nucleoside triphosphate hydrolase protein [Hypoxylon sp. FL1150]